MLVHEKRRHSTSNNILRWLIDEHGGSCVARKAEHVISGGSPARVANAFDPLERAGHVRIYAQGKAYGDSIVVVTPAGLLWRSYIDRSEEEVRGTRLDMHVKVRTLEAALAPFAKVWLDYVGRGEDGNVAQLKCGLDFNIEAKLGAVVFAMAAEILYPRKNSPVIYPWTPGNFEAKAPVIGGRRKKERP